MAIRGYRDHKSGPMYPRAKLLLIVAVIFLILSLPRLIPLH